jgi:hypothetical protein
LSFRVISYGFEAAIIKTDCQFTWHVFLDRDLVIQVHIIGKIGDAETTQAQHILDLIPLYLTTDGQGILQSFYLEFNHSGPVSFYSMNLSML